MPQDEGWEIFSHLSVQFMLALCLAQNQDAQRSGWYYTEACQQRVKSSRFSLLTFMAPHPIQLLSEEDFVVHVPLADCVYDRFQQKSDRTSGRQLNAELL